MPRAVKWTPEVVIATIQARHRAGQPLNSNYMQQRVATLYVVACKRFGSWKLAITKAGIDYELFRAQPPQRKWSKTAIKREILRRYRKGLSLSASAIEKEDPGLADAASRYFGNRGWKKALTYAGLDHREFNQRVLWSKSVVIEAIKQRRKLGLPLNVGSLKSPPLRSLRGGGESAFGSWSKAITAAGMAYSSVRMHKGKLWWSKTRIKQQIRRLHRRGVRLSSRSIQSKYRSLFGAARYRYDSWGHAVEAAGISYRQQRLLWSTRAWLEGLSESDYRNILDKAQTHATKRRRS